MKTIKGFIEFQDIKLILKKPNDNETLIRKNKSDLKKEGEGRGRFKVKRPNLKDTETRPPVRTCIKLLLKYDRETEEIKDCMIKLLQFKKKNNFLTTMGELMKIFSKIYHKV